MVLIQSEADSKTISKKSFNKFLTNVDGLMDSRKPIFASTSAFAFKYRSTADVEFLTIASVPCHGRMQNAIDQINHRRKNQNAEP